MRILPFYFLLLPFLVACDLRPKILSLPDSVGEFIAARYPAMLADPATQPDIYNSAASDYGVYASPDVYGSSATDDYILYARADDYTMPTQVQVAVLEQGDDVIVVPNAAKAEDYLIVPKYGTPDAPTPPVAPIMATPVRADVVTIAVVPGDTLYSLSRKYSIPVNDLAAMNGFTPPFALYAGQQVRVPKITNVQMPDNKVVKVVGADNIRPIAAQPQQKTVSSDPTKPLPKIAARASSKFSWPVRGTTLSAYGAKRSGLFNDGINIGASAGTSVAAAENGVVAYAGNEVKGMGNLIIVQHSDGWMTVYAHLNQMLVRRGTRVNVGQKIGTVGQTGKVDVPQLHFEIRKGTKAYDPVAYLKK